MALKFMIYFSAHFFYDFLTKESDMTKEKGEFLCM